MFPLIMWRHSAVRRDGLLHNGEQGEREQIICPIKEVGDLRVCGRGAAEANAGRMMALDTRL